MKLLNKVAVITGGGRGIGKAIALEFAREGAYIIVNYKKSRGEAYKVVEEANKLGVSALAVYADVSKYKDVLNMAKTVLNKYGKVDILVNNAGVLINKKLLETSVREWTKVVNVNLNGVFYTIKVFGKIMVSNGGGSIINIASVAGYIPLMNGGAYSASKAAVIMLTKQAALELASKGIRVNAICPGPIKTDMLLSEYTERELRIRERYMPLMRIADPIDVAKLAVFLASDDSKYITGEAYGIDGGFAISTYLLLNKLLKRD